MKKTISIFLLSLLALVSFQMKADMWIIGGVSPDGWNPSKGVAMTSDDGDLYTAEIEITANGDQYFSLTSKLADDANDWDGIKDYRFGGNYAMQVDSIQLLEGGTDQRPHCYFQAGTYKFIFTKSTTTLLIQKVSSIELPTFNGTIYVSKNSIGNIWTWDDGGAYFDAWPGVAISTLDTATVKGVQYYAFTYTHNTTSPGLIFNDGTAQTGNLVPEDGMVYTYLGGDSFTVSEPQEPEVPQPVADVYVLGGVNGQSWSAYNGVKMNYDADSLVYRLDITTAGEIAGYSYFSFTTKLAEPTDTTDNGWAAIAPYRFGAIAEGDFLVTEELLGQQLALSEQGSAVAFKIPAGEYSLVLDLAARRLVIDGSFAPVPVSDKVYVIGQVNDLTWAANAGVEMTMVEDGVYEAEIEILGSTEGYDYFGFTKALADSANAWDEIAPYRFSVVSEGDFWVTDSLLNKPLALSEMGVTGALRIAKGLYYLQVNFNENTLTISALEPTPIVGDLNGDGDLDVTDVTLLVKAVLEGTAYDPVCDVTDNGSIDVSDVTALIELVLK
ncbi:MAG: hypothetical protein Q4B68_09060 [Bacteroidales bacterium]|nr:hypothetical protein [Bacteroidales bacterium]